MSNRAVTVIPPTISTLARMPLAQTAKRRVAGYARVSTDSKEQMTSYKTQVDYYTRYIQEQPDWKFVGVYTDEGISAVNTKKRDGFNQMVRDALNGKIDLIVTKSVSRFARNTVDSLVTVRKPFPLAPCDVLGNGAAFLLRQRRHDRYEQFALTVKRVDVFFLKVNLDALFFEFTDGH